MDLAKQDGASLFRANRHFQTRNHRFVCCFVAELFLMELLQLMENLRKKPLPRESMFPDSDDESQRRSSLTDALESVMNEKVRGRKKSLSFADYG